eukprot:snap_masked-scaffold_20-processed-gene-4.31-mRNA-1 protein AED:1.00 eAED:1.00 QI:0/-1/0/0/-1/1/1/0/291
MKRVLQLWTRDINTGKSALGRESALSLYSAEFAQKLRRSFRLSNALVFKAQLLYFLFALALFTALLDFSYLYTLFNPDDVYVDEKRKWLPGKKARDFFIMSQHNLYFSGILQTAICWFTIGVKGTFATDEIIHYVQRRVYLIRFFQIALPISYVISYKRAPNIFNTSALFFLCYLLVIVAIYVASRTLFRKMNNAEDGELRRQAGLLNTCVRDIIISCMLVFLTVVPLALLSTLRPVLPLWLIRTIYPEKGGVNYFILVPHVFRTIGFSYFVNSMLKYFDRSAEKNRVSQN